MEVYMKKGKKYAITAWGCTDNYFSEGKVKGFDTTCDCCGKRVVNPYGFLLPTTENTTYEECINGNFTSHIFFGASCIKKIDIKEA